jgi:hypothetical protein
MMTVLCLSREANERVDVRVLGLLAGWASPVLTD